MTPRNSIAEVLELRRLFSLSAVTLAGPLTPGDAWQYDGGFLNAGETVTVENGSDDPKVSGNNLLTITTSTEDVANIPAESELQVGLSSTKGLIAYGNDFEAGGFEVIPPVYHVDNPPAVLFPPVIAAGHVYKNTFSNVALTAYVGEAPAHASSLLLVSDQLQSITVPAGTFGCYELVNSSRGTTQWIAPGVGLVLEDIAQESSPYLQLASYTIQPQLVPDILGTTLSSTVTSGSTVNATASVELTNAGTTPYALGSVILDIYATKDQAIDSKAVLLSSVEQQTTTLNAAGSEVVSVPISEIPANLHGNYTLHARTADFYGQILDAGSGFVLHVSPGVANLQTLITTAVAPQGIAGQALITIRITNTGEIRSQKSAAIELFSSDDVSQSPASIVAPTVLQIQTLALNLAPGQTRTYHLRLKPAKLKLADQSTHLWADLLSKQDDPSALSRVALPLSG